MTKWCISNMPGEARHCDKTETFSFHYEKYANPQTYTQKTTLHNLPASKEGIYSRRR